MELLRGFPLLAQQFRALFRKNLILAWRNKRSTFLQLFSSLFFIFGLFCIQKSLKVMAFRTKSEVDDWLLRNPMTCPGALHFTERNDTVITYGIQTNSTSVEKRGQYEDPTFKFQIPLQLAAEREIARSLIKGPTFFLATAMFGFVFQISSLITEKELKLRQAMSMMGLYETAYWISWLTWEGILALLSSTLTVLFGMIYAFMLSGFISKSSSSTVVGFSIFIIGFLTQASDPLLDFEANVTYPVSIMDLSFSLQVVTQVGFPYSSSFSGTFRFVWSLFPPNLLTEGLILLSAATATPNDPGVSWSKRGKCAPNDTQCVMTLKPLLPFAMSMQKPLLPFTRLKQKPLGVRYVEIPGTESAENAKGAMVEVYWEQGVMVEVYWEQQDSGALSFSSSGSSQQPPASSLPQTPTALIWDRALGLDFAKTTSTSAALGSIGLKGGHVAKHQSYPRILATAKRPTKDSPPPPRLPLNDFHATISQEKKATPPMTRTNVKAGIRTVAQCKEDLAASLDF
ncbi:hypothetical protein RHSIM_Rhsim12G0158000 [Rhododendron simsii]|uniref:ABC-2 type transporter transmembrane domain-containing protein n=1 Tax=Rhododendron simsii TaxID=118357 RepID=A0A834G7I8_RHOSS|nr:hypothetical protein RHSIM_Rhsim12G0158000 [Rhododendron simsii]